VQEEPCREHEAGQIVLDFTGHDVPMAAGIECQKKERHHHHALSEATAADADHRQAQADERQRIEQLDGPDAACAVQRRVEHRPEKTPGVVHVRRDRDQSFADAQTKVDRAEDIAVDAPVQPGDNPRLQQDGARDDQHEGEVGSPVV